MSRHHHSSLWRGVQAARRRDHPGVPNAMPMALGGKFSLRQTVREVWPASEMALMVGAGMLFLTPGLVLTLSSETSMWLTLVISVLFWCLLVAALAIVAAPFYVLWRLWASRQQTSSES